MGLDLCHRRNTTGQKSLMVGTMEGEILEEEVTLRSLGILSCPWRGR